MYGRLSQRATPPPLDPSLIASIINSYTGEHLSKFYHGLGTAVFLNGQVYTGNFWMGHMHGRGKITWPDDVVYEGDFDFDDLNGQGKYFWPDGSRYEGGIHHGKRHGRGHFSSNDIVYDGDWVDGYEEGNGLKVYANEVSYDGEWKRGLRHGQGTMKYSKFHVYEGSWKDDVKAGRGLMKWLDKGEYYEGEWLNDQQHGYGVQVWKCTQKEGRENRYEGDFSNGVRDGYGIFFYANGSRYEGHWEKNVKHGLGLMFFEDGTIYEGEFDNDKMADVNDNKPKGSDTTAILILYVEDLVQGNEKERIKGVKAAQHAVLRVNTDLRQVYRHYASRDKPLPSSGLPTLDTHLDLMEMRSLWQFSAECCLTNVTMGKLDRYLLTVRNAQNKAVKKLRIQREKKRRQMNARAMDAIVTPREKWLDIHDPNRLILYREFCEILVRIAWDEALAHGEIDMTVTDAFTWFYEDKIHDYSPSEIDSLCVDMFTPNMQSVFSKFSDVLQRLFSSYSALDPPNRDKNDMTLSLRNLIHLLRDHKGIPELTISQLLQLFYRPFDDGNDENDGDFDPFLLDTELIYPEFLHALCKVAITLNSIQSVPFHVTVSQYIQDTFLTPATDLSTWGPTTNLTTPMTLKRVYIGRLPEDVTKDELVDRFERLVPSGVVLEDVQLMANSAASDFAYLTVRSSARDEDLEERIVDALVKAYHNTKWKGKRLRVEIAKPDYLERLRLLREEDAKRREDTILVRNEMLSSTGFENPVLELKKTKRYRGKRVVFDENGGVADVEKADTANLSTETLDEESDEDVESVRESLEVQEMDVNSDDEENSHENYVVMDDKDELSSETSEEELQEQEDELQDGELSSETSEEEDVEAENELSSETSEEEKSDDKNQDDSSDAEEELDIEAEIQKELNANDEEEDLDIEAEIQKELNANDTEEELDVQAEIQKELKGKAVPVMDEAARKEAANARRLAAIQEREALAKAAKIKKPAPIANKKITFGSDDEGEDTAFQSVVTTKSDSKKRSFLSDSEDDYDEDFLGLNSKRQKTEALFEFRPEFAGVGGKKLFEMQKRFGGDQRFRLDARFVEGDEFNDGMDAMEPSEEPVDDTIQELRVEAEDAEETAKQQYIEETSRALDVLEQIFPTMELAKAKARLQRSLEPERDLKQLGWLGAVRRYDPRDVTAKSMEQS
ncbi:radial spoke head 10 family protein, partial [Thraustotheca clavata]